MQQEGAPTIVSKYVLDWTKTREKERDAVFRKDFITLKQ
jgi:hypothetical protein